MRKFLTGLVALTLLVSLCGCLEQEPSTTYPLPTSPQETNSLQAKEDAPEIPEIPPLDAAASEELELLTRYDQTIAWRDPYDQYHTMTLRLPALTPCTDFAISWNEEVRQMGELLLNEITASWEKGYFPSTVSLTYDVYMQDGISFIIMERRMSEAYSMYYVDAFDFQEQRQLTKGERIRVLTGLDYPTFLHVATELTMNEFIRSYSFDAQEIEEIAESGSENDITEAQEQFLENYYRILETFPYQTVYLYQADVFPDQTGQTALYICAPEGYQMDSLRYVIPYSDADLEIPSEEEAYGRLLDIQHHVDGAHATAYGLILKDAFFADPDTFIRYASNESINSMNTLAQFLRFSLDEKEIAEFDRICTEISGKDLSQNEASFVQLLILK